MNFIKKNFYKLILLCSLFVPFLKISAQAVVGAATVRIANPISATTVDGFIKAVLVGVIKIGIPIIALAVIYSGFLFVTAQGNSEKITTAKRALTYSLIGAAILLGSWAIAQLISSTVVGVTS